MPLDLTAELQIREALATTIATVAPHVIPSARYTSGYESFWSSVDPTKLTQYDIETNPVEAVWLYPIQFDDDFASGFADCPLVSLTYEIYVFYQYGDLRMDESATPDVFDKKVLEQHNKFIETWLGLKEAFQRVASLGLAGFTVIDSHPLIQAESIQNQVVCEFVPGVVGFSARLNETIKILC